MDSELRNKPMKMYLTFATLFLALFCTPSQAAVFPLTYPINDTTVPRALKKFLPMLETAISANQRSELSVYAYQKLANLPMFNESGWVITLLHNDNTPDVPYTNPENFHTFFLGDSGRFKPIVPLYARFFFINPSSSSLAFVQIAANGHPGKRFDGDSLFIDDFLSRKQLLSLYDRDDTDELPSNTYSQLYFYDFDQTKAIEIFQHEITFAYRKDLKGTVVLQSLKTTSRLYIYKNGVYDEKPIDNKQAEKYFSIVKARPDIMACETFPCDSIQPADFKRLGVKALQLNYNLGNKDTFPSE